MPQQQSVAEADGSEVDSQGVRRVSAGTITVFTKFGAHASPGHGFGSIDGLLASKPGDAEPVFKLYARLFKNAAVGKCLTNHATGVFLKENEFMDRYRVDLASEQPRYRVWNSGYHQQLRAFFSA